ncbi:hypothetical protein [Methylocystis rosea]|uniref:hypothetical protein n=1 Tax=Methylocystis rosea TaxID=173366 RepID=UPI0003609AD8|nr:hypothetical protein [Methylocystis rosea]
MSDKADHIAWAAEVISAFQRRCRTSDEHVIADLICDLGHLADERGLDFLSEVARGIAVASSAKHVAQPHATIATRRNIHEIGGLHVML